MARTARDEKLSRRSWLLAGVGVFVSPAHGEGKLFVSWDGDDLHVAAPQLHFLSGKPLERLKDGATVLYLSQLTLFADRFTTVMRRAPDRFAVSLDIWEERFSVTRLGGEARSASYLTAPAAESWCLENMAISSSGLMRDRDFWLRFELRAADP